MRCAYRAECIKFPLGNPFGQAFDEELQKQVLVDLLSILKEAEEPASMYGLHIDGGEDASVGRDETVLQQVEDMINDAVTVIEAYGSEMERDLSTRDPRDSVAKLAPLQVIRVGWLQDLGEQMEETPRGMLDRIQGLEAAEAGWFRGRSDDVKS